MSEPTAPRQPIVLPTLSNLLGFPRPAGLPPVDLIAHPGWNEALERITTVVNAGPACIVLLGAPGTGKTALLRHVTAILRERGRTACLLDSGDSPVDVTPAEILLIDEAERIGDARLEEFCSRSDVAVVFAALPASRKRFASCPGMSVIRLPRLTPEEACKFVAARLAQLGLPRGCLTEAAWAQLIAHGRGIPRLLLGVLGHALFVACEEHGACVTAAHVEEAFAARGVGPGAIAVEPLPAQPDSVPEQLPAIIPPQAITYTEGRSELTKGRRYVSRIMAGLYWVWVAAFISSMYAVPVVAWLAWSTYRHKHTVAARDTEDTAVVLAQTSPAVPVGAVPVGAVPVGAMPVGAMPAGAERVGGLAANAPHSGASVADAQSPWHDTVIAEGPAQPAASAPVATAKEPGPGSRAPALPARSAGDGAIGVENPAQPAAQAAPQTALSAPVVVAQGLGSDAPAMQAGSAGQGTPGVTRQRNGAEARNIAPESAASGVMPGAVAKPPWGQFAPPGPAEHRGVPPSRLKPVLAEHSPAVADRGRTSADAAGITERRSKFEDRTRYAAASDPERYRARTQSEQPPHRLGQASRNEAGIRPQVAQSSYHEIPTIDARQAPVPGPSPRADFMQHSTAIHVPSPMQQLLSARKALVESNSAAARGLLEAAQTAIVFEAGAAPRGNGIAVGQIVHALSLLNSGSTAGALPHLDRAIVALQPAS